MDSRFIKGLRWFFWGPLLFLALVPQAFAQATMDPLIAGLEELTAGIQEALGQSSQLSQTLIGQWLGALASENSQNTETQGQGPLTPEQEGHQELITEGIAHMRAWDQALLEEIQPIMRLLEGRSNPGTIDYWFFEALSDQVVSILARAEELSKALGGSNPGTAQACQIAPNSRFLCDPSAWEDFRESFIVESYGSPALKDSSINDAYAWSLAYLSGVFLRLAQEDLQEIAQGLPSASPLLPLLNENLAVMAQTDAFIEDRLADYPRIPPMEVIEAADAIPQTQAEDDGI